MELRINFFAPLKIMKKKSAIALILFLFGILIAAPIITQGAMPKPNECCRVGHNLSDIDGVCNFVAPATSIIVGPNNTTAWCDLDEDGNPATNPVTGITAKWGMCCLFDTMYDITDYVFWIFFVIAILAFMLSGYCFLFSGGDPAQLEKGKGYLMWGIIGLTVAILSKVIPAVVKIIIL